MYDHDHYGYDRAGNLLGGEHPGPVMSNRLPGYGSERYSYNEWGELETRRGQEYRWNAQGQLTTVISSNSRTHYRYDALGRRISKVSAGGHTRQAERSRTEFIWEGYRLLQEIPAGGERRTYLYDAEQPYTPAASVTGRKGYQQVWYYHTDPAGTVQEVTKADGTLVWAGYHAAFGEMRADISGSREYYPQPLRMPGQYFDEETGLHYNLFRYYAPECGRFISQDPIGLRGGLNLYAYAPNPLKYIDPLGLTTCHGTTAQGNPHYSGTDKPLTTGATPNSIYTHIDPKTGKAVQNAIYDSNGSVIGHVDFKNHGIESGHYHEFPIPGNPASGHGAGKPHNPYSTIPSGWDILPPGIEPHTPIGQ